MKKNIDCHLDLRGMLVPLSLLKATQAFRGLGPGETLEILGSDPETRQDLFRVLDASRYKLMAFEDKLDFYRVLLRKKS